MSVPCGQSISSRLHQLSVASSALKLNPQIQVNLPDCFPQLLLEGAGDLAYSSRRTDVHRRIGIVRVIEDVGHQSPELDSHALVYAKIFHCREIEVDRFRSSDDIDSRVPETADISRALANRIAVGAARNGEGLGIKPVCEGLAGRKSPAPNAVRPGNECVG